MICNMKDVGKEKAFVIKEKIEKLNPDVKVVPYNTKLTSQNALEMMKEYDMLADCSDNFPTRYLVNDACVMLNKPLSRGTVPRFEGLLMTILPKVSACYRCVLENLLHPGRFHHATKRESWEPRVGR